VTTTFGWALELMCPLPTSTHIITLKKLQHSIILLVGWRCWGILNGSTKGTWLPRYKSLMHYMYFACKQIVHFVLEQTNFGMEGILVKKTNILGLGRHKAWARTLRYVGRIWSLTLIETPKCWPGKWATIHLKWVLVVSFKAKKYNLIVHTKKICNV
jgi:hypothetical protein